MLFNLAQSPEQEVHGHLLEEARASVDELLCVCDETRFARRLADEERSGSRLSGERLEERRRAWRRIARESGLECASVALEQPVDDGVLEEVRRALTSSERRVQPANPVQA